MAVATCSLQRLVTAQPEPGTRQTKRCKVCRGVPQLCSRLQPPVDAAAGRRRHVARAPSTPSDAAGVPRAEEAGPLGRLRQTAPFFTDAALVAPLVTYDGPLCQLSGAADFTRTQAAWAKQLQSRLKDFAATNVSLYARSPTHLTLRWKAAFAAALPPRAAERLKEVGEVTPPLRRDGLVDVTLSLTAELYLDESGAIVRYVERITDDFSVRATIARYEWLTARRLDGTLSAVWYYQVLRYTSLEEAADAAGTSPDDDSLQRGFALMVGRNFGVGLALGAVIYTVVRAIKLAALHGQML